MGRRCQQVGAPMASSTSISGPVPAACSPPPQSHHPPATHQVVPPAVTVMLAPGKGEGRGGRRRGGGQVLGQTMHASAPAPTRVWVLVAPRVHQLLLTVVDVGGDHPGTDGPPAVGHDCPFSHPDTRGDFNPITIRCGPSQPGAKPQPTRALAPAAGTGVRPGRHAPPCRLGPEQARTPIYDSYGPPGGAGDGKQRVQDAAEPWQCVGGAGKEERGWGCGVELGGVAWQAPLSGHTWVLTAHVAGDALDEADEHGDNQGHGCKQTARHERCSGCGLRPAQVIASLLPHRHGTHQRQHTHRSTASSTSKIHCPEDR